MNIQDHIAAQKEFCQWQINISDDNELTVWALGGFVPIEHDEAVIFLAHSPPYTKKQPPKLSMSPNRLATYIDEENQHRAMLVQKLNSFLVFLDQALGSVYKACTAAGISRQQVEKLRIRCETLDQLWYEIEEAVTDKLEDAVLSRAINGVEKIVYHKGVECGKEKKYSDVLAGMALQGRRPDKYRHKSTQEVTGAGGGPLESKHTEVVVYIPDNGRGDNSQNDD